MAETVLAAAHPLPVFVACDDDAVAAWARRWDATAVWTEGHDLNGAVAVGLTAARSAGATTLLIAHADLPQATDLPAIAHFPGVTLVPDFRDDGTNVIALPAETPFVPAYGPGSFARHLAQALTFDVPVRVCRRADLRLDVDAPADLAAMRA